jgi:hypothetical protein
LSKSLKKFRGVCPKERKPIYFIHLSSKGHTQVKEIIKSHIKELFYGSEFLCVINLQGIEIGEKHYRK